MASFESTLNSYDGPRGLSPGPSVDLQKGSSLRIAILTPTFLPSTGGAEKGIHFLAERLAAWHEVTVFTPGFEGHSDLGDSLGYHVVQHPMPPGLSEFTGRPGSAWLKANRWMVRALGKHHSDVVLIFYMAHYSLVAIIGSVIRKWPTAISIIGRDVELGSYTFPERLLIRASLRAVSQRIFISEYARSRLGASLGRPLRGVVIPLSSAQAISSSSDADRQAVRTVWGIPEGDQVVFALQRLSPVKRFDTVIRAFSLVLQSHPRSWLVVGGTGRQLDNLRELSRELGIAERVRFLGYVPTEDVQTCLLASNIFVFHSTFETLGLSVLEGMMAGLPVVCADSTAAQEVIREGVTGLIAKPLNDQDLAEKLTRLMNDRELAQSMGAEAKREALERYHPDKCAAQYSDLLLSMHRAPENT